MSHLNMGPNPVLDKVFRQWCEEFRRKNIHLIPPQRSLTPAETRNLASYNKTLYHKESSGLSLWARAWLKVAKGWK